MNIVSFCIDRKRSVIFLMVLLLLCGVYSYLKIPREDKPEIKIPNVYVLVTQRGISPEDARKMLLQPLEEGLQGLDGVKQMTSHAFDGGASIIIEFNAGTDPDKSVDDVRNKVNDSTHKLPIDADRPMIYQVDLSQLPVLNIILMGNSDMSQRELLAIARESKRQLMKLPMIRSINIAGEVEEAVQIIIKPEVMEKYRLSVDYLRQIITSNNLMVTAGTLRKKDGEFAIKIPSLISDYAELMEFPVYSSNGVVLKLKDVATVIREFKSPKTIARANGRSAVVLEVSKRSGENIIHAVEGAKMIMEEIKKQLPEGFEIIYANDESHKIVEQVDELENGIIFASIIILILVIMAVGIKSALLISLSIPVAFFACILMMEMSGYTLNIVVLFSLILSVGMVVDDSIVVSEYADRKLMEGKAADESFLEAAIRMFWPIFTSTLVKMVVFVPFLFWPGILGQFMKYMPITVIIILTNSIIFSLIFQTSIGGILMKGHKGSEKELKSIIAAESGPLSDIKGLTGQYVQILESLMQKPWHFVVGICGLMVATIIIFMKFSVGVEFFPSIEPNNATVVIRSAGNLSIHQKNEIVSEVEQRLFQFKDAVKVFYTKVGSVDGADDAIGTITLEFSDWQQREKASIIIEKMLEATKDIEGAIVQVNEARVGPVQGKPIKLNIIANDHEKSKHFTEKLKYAMENELGGFKDINTSLPIPGIEWHLVVDREIAAKHMLSTSSVGTLMQMVTDGARISTCRLEDLDYEVDVLLRFPEKTRTVSNLENLRIVNMNGDIIPLNKFVKRRYKPSVSTITRINQEDVYTLESDVVAGSIINNQLKKIQGWVKNNAEDGIRIDFKGDSEEQAETAEFLRNAFFLILAITFLIMLTQFNNFYDASVVMSAVFLSITGVLLGLLITGRPFGIVMCGIGIIALAGIVLNNNILMVDTFHHLRNMGYSYHEAIVRAGAQRARPIVLTAAASILSLLPMATSITLNFMDRTITHGAPSTQWWTQLSTSISGGLAFATLLTLFFTPCLLAVRYCRK